MKIAVPTQNDLVDSHFGHCENFTIFTVDENNKIAEKRNYESPAGCGCKSNLAPLLANEGVKIMLAGGIGGGAINILEMHGIKVIRGCDGNVDELMNNFLTGKVSDGGETCNLHEGCEH